MCVPTDHKVKLTGYHWTQQEIEGHSQDGVTYIALNMTSKCNYRCQYCFVGLYNLSKSRDELTLNEKKDVLRAAKERGAKVLSMPGRGEPLADPDFWFVLEEANRLGMWVVVYTNGYYLSEEFIARLKDLPISLYIKIDSLDAAIYENIVGAQGVFARISKNLDLLLKYFHEPIKEGNAVLTRLGINSVVTAQTVDGIEKIHRLCQEKQIYYTCRSPVRVGEADRAWPMLVQEQAARLQEVGQKYADRSFTSATPLGQCGIYRFGITVDNNGEILVCPDAHEGFERIGNIRESSLKELISRRNKLFLLNSTPDYCFVKAHRNTLTAGYQ